MKRGIFSQLFFYTMMTILFGFFVMGVLVYSLLGSYLADYKKDDLQYVAETLADFTVKLGHQNPNYSKDSYQMNVDALSFSTDAFIVVLNTEGKIVAATSGREDVTVRQEFYKDVLRGKTVQHMGTLGGVFDTTTLTVGVPILFGENRVAGAVLASLSMPEIQRMRGGVLHIFMIAMILVFLVVLVLVYSLSARIIRPVKNLNNAAKAIAAGRFNRRVEIEDKNEIGELAESFNTMAESLEHLEEMRSSFIANISHDLRTPMTTISGFVGGILDGTIPPAEEKRYLSIVMDETNRLSRLVTDLLDLSKIESGNFSVELRELDINELIRLTIIKLEKRITEKEIHLTVNFQKDSQWVMADRDSILRVLTNLFDNAVKYTDRGGFIDISTGVMEKDKVFVTVQNSGPGIEKEDLIHIFDRFYKTDKSRGQDKQGTGLGLYIVQNILKSYGETIWAESEPGEFTRFHFTLAKAENPKNTGIYEA